MFNLNIYTKYKITEKCEYSYINEDGDFSTGTVTNVYENLTSNDVIDIIHKAVKDRDFWEMNIENNNVIHLSNFDPHNGTGSDSEMTIEEQDDKTEGFRC